MLGMFTDLEVAFRALADRGRLAVRREHGAGIVEYLLLVVFIALVLIAALAFFSGRLDSAFSRAGSSVPTS